MTGQIVAIPVEPNVPVKANDVLFQIDPAPFQYKVVRTDTVTALKLMLHSYLDQRLPGIAEMADIAGTSVRSLQRELAFAGLSYSRLLDQVRFEKGAELLRKIDARIIDVAFATGYTDPAHFARAFRLMTGVTPREFRENSPDDHFHGGRAALPVRMREKSARL